MALKSELMADGMPSQQANHLGYDPVANFTAAGTTQATATALSGNNANITTSSIGAGVVVPTSREKCSIYNAGPNVLTVYPIVGGAFSGLATNAGVQVASGFTMRAEGGGLAGMTWVVSG